VVLFNGTNADPQSKEIYNNWVERHKGSDRVTGSRTADMRAALVDYFRVEVSIMIASEADAEKINLQFCSMVVNYDLPWNPQRIEQRIGRCRRAYLRQGCRKCVGRLLKGYRGNSHNPLFKWRAQSDSNSRPPGS
jgi:superfamily II DNA/RNA helicase